MEGSAYSRKPWEVIHSPKCKCCHFLKRKMDIRRIHCRNLSKEDKKLAIQALPNNFGFHNVYKLDPNHMDVCDCCLALKEFRQKERKYSARYVGRHKFQVK